MIDDGVLIDFDNSASEWLVPVTNAYLGSPLTGISGRRLRQNRCLRRIITSAFARYHPNPYSVYDPANFTGPGTNHTPEEVCTIDHLRGVNSDLFICLHTQPSSGLGIESSTAMLALVPRILISPHGLPISRMLQGTACSEIDPIVYSSNSDLERQLQGRIRQIDLSVQEKRPARRRLLNDHVAESRGRKVLRKRLQKGLTRQELAQKTHVPEHIIRAIEAYELFTVVVGSTQWPQLATALNCTVRLGRGAAPSLVDESPTKILSPCLSDSLENYLDFVIGTPNLDDRKVVSIWSSYDEMQSQALAGRESLDRVISVEEWKGIYESWKSPPNLLI